ncbi:MAG TPA: type II secretion system protein [Terriglobia bacterium]|nr:type II secretion system protein [Terriglobia bacterium]
MKRTRKDAGFSLAALVFFLTATSILIAVAVPNWVMQARREREKELIFRGEEYARAIQKYQRTLNLLPSSVDDLLSSNGTRFLRKAYADPVSGEPWRVIILNSDGTLTGSNVYQSMAQVPTTTSVANTPPATKGTSSPTSKSVGSLSTSPIASSTGGGLGAGGGGGLGAGGGGGLGAVGGGGLGAGGGGGLTGGGANRPTTGGAVSPTSPAGQQPQPVQSAQAVPLQGIVGVGSGSRGNGVMVYLKQEQYSNWEFLAQLQQRPTGQNGQQNPQQQQPQGQQQNQQQRPR